MLSKRLGGGVDSRWREVMEGGEEGGEEGNDQMGCFRGRRRVAPERHAVLRQPLRDVIY